MIGVSSFTVLVTCFEKLRSVPLKFYCNPVYRDRSEGPFFGMAPNVGGRTLSLQVQGLGLVM